MYIVSYTCTCTLMVCLCASKNCKFQTVLALKNRLESVIVTINAYIFKLVVFLPYTLHAEQRCGYRLLVGRAKQLQLLILSK